MSLQPHFAKRSAFTLIEVLIATAIVAATGTVIYYAFLRMNDYAIASRADTAAKVVLERAVNLAMTTDWSSSTPPILTVTSGFQTFDPNTGLNSDGSTSVFTDPNNNVIVTGTISRNVTQYVSPAATPLGNVVQIVFKLDYKLHKRTDEPVTSAYAYTVRAGDQ